MVMAGIGIVTGIVGIGFGVFVLRNQRERSRRAKFMAVMAICFGLLGISMCIVSLLVS
jgi:hypothetical protein